MVTATGFKPVTPTSVVWYSIQLSYAAIALFCECKDRAFFLIYKDRIEKSFIYYVLICSSKSIKY